MQGEIKTTLSYLKDTYVFAGKARVLRFYACDTKPFYACILEDTLFYPQGGGQPCDTGHMYSDTGQFRVEKVFFGQEGEVIHQGIFTKGIFDKDQQVYIKIDKGRRLLNARLHSAGHIIDLAVQETTAKLKAVKGYHFPDNPLVEFLGVVEDVDAFMECIKATVCNIVEQNRKVRTKCLFAKGKLLRYVSFGDSPSCGCGGTHVSHTKEVGTIHIHKIQAKKGKTKIFYRLEPQ